MATSSKWRLNVSANNGHADRLVVGEMQLRTQPGVARQFYAQSSISCAVTRTGDAAPGGVASLTKLSDYGSDSWKNVAFPFAVTFGGVSYTSCIVNSYGLVIFGTGADTSHNWDYDPLSGNSPPYPHFVLGDAAPKPYGSNAGSSTFHKLYAGAENGGTTFRIRLEMNAGYDDATGVADTIWEITFDSANPGVITFDFVTCGYPDPEAGIGDGKVAFYVGTFDSLNNSRYSVVTAARAADGTITASNFVSGNDPKFAADGDLNMFWLGSTATGQLVFEFAEPVEIQQYVITSPSNWWNDHMANPMDWTFDYWDPGASAWQVADTQSGQSGWGFKETRTFNMAGAVEPDGMYDGDARLPELTLSAGGTIVYPPNVINGDVNLGNRNNLGTDFDATPLTLLAGAYVPNFGAGEIAFEALTMTGGFGDPAVLPLMTVNAVGQAGNVATGSALLPALRLSGAMDGPLSFEALTMAASGFAGVTGTYAGALQALEADGIMVPGSAAAGAAELAPLAVEAFGGLAGSAALPPFDITAAGHAGVTGAAALLMDKFTLSASASADALPAAGDAAITGMDAAGRMLSGTVADGAAAIAALGASGDGMADNQAAATISLAAMDAAATGIAGEALAGAISLAGMTIAGVATAPPPDNAGEGAATLATLNLTAGRMLAGPMGNGAVSTSMLTLVAAGEAENLINGAAAFLPATLSGQSALAVDGDGAGAAVLPQVQAAGVSLAGTMGAGAVLMVAPTLSASSLIDTIAAGNATLAAFTSAGEAVSSGAPTTSAGDARFAPLQASAIAITGIMASGAAPMRALTLAATSFADLVASGDARFAVMTAAGAGYSDATAAGAITLQAAGVAASAEAGNIGSAVLTVPLVRVDADGFEDAIGTATVSLPVLALEAAGIAGVPDPVFVGVALNTHTRAVSTYDGLAYNSLAEFNGMVLAATASGIVALTGDNDQGAPIVAQVAGGVSDLGAPQFKRVLAGYVGYRAAGTLDLTMVTDEHHEYVYKLEPRRLDQIHASRVKFGRGVEGRYWQWKLANRDGADFALDALTLDATALSRRLG